MGIIDVNEKVIEKYLGKNVKVIHETLGTKAQFRLENFEIDYSASEKELMLVNKGIFKFEKKYPVEISRDQDLNEMIEEISKILSRYTLDLTISLIEKKEPVSSRFSFDKYSWYDFKTDARQLIAMIL